MLSALAVSRIKLSIKYITMKIFAVGMNYPQCNKAQQDALCKQEPPCIFTKADSSLLKNHKPFFVPDWSERVDYEAEIVVRICRLGKGIPERFAHRYYDALTVGVDFTDRDMENRLRAAGQPWDLCKGFDGAAAIGDWVEVGKFRDVQALNFHLDVNGQTVQQGFTGDMTHRIDELVAYISRFCTLKTGDLLYTGTPSGAGKVNIGDHIEGYVDDRKVLEFNCR